MSVRSLISNRYTKNTFFLLFEKISRLAVELLVWVLIARYLGPEGLGKITFAQSLVALLVPLANLGLDNFIIIDCVSARRERGNTVFTAFCLKLASAVICLLLLLLVVYPFISSEKAPNLIYILISITIVFQAFNVIELYFQAEVRSKYVVMVKLLQAVVSALFKFWLILVSAPIEWIAGALLIDSILLAVVLAVVFYLKADTPKLYVSRNKVQSLLLRSWPLILSGAAIVVYMKIDMVMLQLIVGERTVGIYSAAARVSEVFYFIPVIVVGSLFPAIIKAKNESASMYQLRLKQLYCLMAAGAISIAVVVTFLAEFLIGLFFGEQYVESVLVLQIHVWACLSVFMGVSRSKWMSNEGLQKYDLMLNVAGGLINIAFNLFLIPKYGANGAAVATLLSYFSVTLFLPLFIKDVRSMTLVILKSYIVFPVVLRASLLR